MTTDAALVSRTKDGDEEAFRALYERHRPAVERVCRKWLRDPYLVEDAVQGTFLKAWTAMPDFSGGAQVDRWLRRIAKNHCHDVWRSLTRAEALGRGEDPAVGRADPASLRLAGECVDRLAVETMLRNLGRRDASLLVQRHVGEYPVGALAAQWGLTKGAMDVALHRARLRARKLAAAEGLRGLLPVGLLRRFTATMQRLSSSSGDAGVVLMGVCNIAVAVSLSVPDTPPAYADELSVDTASTSASTGVVALRTLAAADHVSTDVRARLYGSRPESSSVGATAKQVEPSAGQHHTPRAAVDRDKRAESYVEFEPVAVPGAGTTISSKPRGRPVRSLVIRHADVSLEENEDPSIANNASPVYDVGCSASETNDSLLYCDDYN